MKTPDTEKCEHKVVKKYCFRCKRPDLAGNVKNTPDTAHAVYQSTEADKCPKCGEDHRLISRCKTPDTEIIKAVPLPHEPAVTTNGDTNGGGGSTTPDAAWKKELEQHIKFCFGGEYGDTADDAINIITAFTTNLLTSRDTYWQQHEKDMYESLDKEYQLQIEHAEKKRDTYWEERVRKIYLKILKKARETDYADTTEYDECAKLLKPLLDNLK